MELHRALLQEPTHTRRLLTPLGITILDGSDRVMGHVLYDVRKDKGIPVLCDGELASFYQLWGERREPLPNPAGRTVFLCTGEKGEEPRGREQCYLRECPCNEPYVRTISHFLVKDRTELMAGDEHWLQGSTTEYHYEMFTDDTLIPRKVPSEEMEDPGKEWKDTWNYDSTLANPLFPYACCYKLSTGIGSKKGGGIGGGKRGQSAVSLLELPLEVYEVLVEYLDGTSLVNLANASVQIEGRVLEPFEFYPVEKKTLMWYNYCTKDLNRSTVLKIWSSFDTAVGRDGAKAKVKRLDLIEALTWETIFKSYKNYWELLVNGNVMVDSLDDFETRLKGETLLFREQCPVPEDGNSKALRITGTGGGRMIYNLMFPNPPELANLIVIEDFGKVDCRNVAHICRTATSPKFVKVKIMLFPDPIVEGGKPSLVNRVVIGACDKCISATPLQGGHTRTVGIPQMEKEYTYCDMGPILEVQDNIGILWLHPGYLLVFMIVPNRNFSERVYDIRVLYRLQTPEMRFIWDTVAQHQSDYLPMIREYKGTTPLLSAESMHVLMGGSSYIFPPTEPTYYGLAMISPIYGIDCMKPKVEFDAELEEPSTIIESIPPQYYRANGKVYLPALREWTCAGKGHGLFVFSADKALAVSWNGVNWIFGPLQLPTAAVRENCLRNVIHVDVIHDHGLLMVVNDNILLIELSLITKPPEVYSGVNLTEPELKVKVVRMFSLGLAPLLMELTHLEFNFDEGRPFLFIIAEKKVRDESGRKWRLDDFSFQMKRVEFF